MRQSRHSECEQRAGGRGKHAQIHDDGLVDLLPQVRAEDLDQANLQRRDLAVHEDAGQIQLHLEADVHVRAVDGGAPPQREPTVRDLVQPAALRVRQLLVLHALLEPRGLCAQSTERQSAEARTKVHDTTHTRPHLLPEEALPRREIGSLEQRVLQDALHAAQGLDDVRPVVVQVPQLAVVAGVGPPAGGGGRRG